MEHAEDVVKIPLEQVCYILLSAEDRDLAENPHGYWTLSGGGGPGRWIGLPREGTIESTRRKIFLRDIIGERVAESAIRSGEISADTIKFFQMNGDILDCRRSNIGIQGKLPL